MPILIEQRPDDRGQIVTVYASTPEEIAEQEAVEAYNQALFECLEARKIAYEEKGWRNEFDVIDDAARRGWEAVNAERLAIKAAFPKPDLAV